MRGKLQAYLDLIRIPNVFTAVADAIAGFLFVGGGMEDWRTLLLLVGASSCLYSGGVALNDVCDVERDTRERADRPIPSGRVSRRAALGLAIGLLGGGFTLAVSISVTAATLGALLVASIILYDVVFKTTGLAPALMGLCRALNLALAMSVTPMFGSPTTIVPVGLMWLYVTSVTYFARREAGVSELSRLLAGTIGVCLAVGGLGSLCWISEPVHAGYLGLTGLLGATLAYRGFTAAASRQPASTQQAVETFVVSLVLFDTCLVWAARGPLTALTVAVLLIPTAVLKHWFRVT